MTGVFHDFFTKFKSILTHPSAFYVSLEREKSWRPAFYYLIISSFVYLIFDFFSSFIFKPPVYVFTPIILNGRDLLTYVISDLFLFVFAGVLHLWIKLFRGKGNYLRTYQIIIYSATPMILISWIRLPFVGTLASAVYFFLVVVGTWKLHKISLKRSISIYFILFLILVVIGLLIGLTVVRNDPNLFLSK